MPPLAPKPASLLGYHRVLSPTAGIKVLPLCLGAVSFGTAWKDFMGECSKERAFEILDTFYGLGGNFIDPANGYQDEQSERIIGEWMKLKGNRDQMVIATKYTSGFHAHNRAEEPLQSNYTSYIDILYLHWWDFTTSVEEVMVGLNALVTSGKVIYLGVSDTPAWIVVKANEYARAHGLRPFSLYQGKWNAGFRDIEREILPMCRDQGMAIAPWAPLGEGKFKTAAQRSEASGSIRATTAEQHDIEVSEALERIADRKSTTLHSIALAYLLHKVPYIFPIVGQRDPKHLLANVNALSVSLSAQEVREIDSVVPFDAGFPLNFLFGPEYRTDMTASDVFWTQVAADVDVPPAQAVIPARPPV
ncbi:Aldo/keto reductase [Aspergillus carlsbadensis]|nr:Aldo/keto reductase [Aspergillus carlsbadensis]